MPFFFAQPSNVLVEQEMILNEYMRKKIKFNPVDTQHTQLISTCAQSVKDKLKNLHHTDIKMTAGFALGTAALLLSYFLPFSIVAIAGFAYGAYQLAQRQAAYLEYTTALENLSKCCIWSLGEVNPQTHYREAINNNPAILEMITTMAPLISTQQLRDFIDDRVEEDFIEMKESIQNNTTIFDDHLLENNTELYFKIYGFKQGGFLAILEGVGYAIKGGFTAVVTSISSLIPSPSPA